MAHMSHQDPAPEPTGLPQASFTDAAAVADPDSPDGAGAPVAPVAGAGGSPAAARRGTLGALVAAVAVLAVLVAVLLGQSLSKGSGPAPAAGSAATGTPVVTAPRASAAPKAATQTSAAAPAATGAVPAGATGFGGPLVLNSAAPAGVPTLDIYEDPQCPICGQFEAIFGPAVTELVKNNEAKVIVHTMTFLDRNLRNDSSVRAANAAFCAADQGKFHDYTIAVYAAQPAREGDGWTDAQLTSFAQSVGLAGTALDSWKTCQQAVTYRAHIAALETNSERSGVNGTPTALLNGTRMNLAGLDAAAFRAAVKAAKP
jgi:protein-disulfide isomerase